MKFIKLKFSSNLETITKKNVEIEREKFLKINKDVNLSDEAKIEMSKNNVVSAFTGEIEIIKGLLNFSQKDVKSLGEFCTLSNAYNRIEALKDSMETTEILIPENEFKFIEKGFNLFIKHTEEDKKNNPNSAWLYYSNLFAQLYAPEFVTDLNIK